MKEIQSRVFLQSGGSWGVTLRGDGVNGDINGIASEDQANAVLVALMAAIGRSQKN